MEDNNNQEEDSVDFGDSQEDFKSVMMRQLSRVCELGSKEMRGGYFTKVLTKSGEEKEVYNEDARESFGAGVLTLSHLLVDQGKTGLLKEGLTNYKNSCDELKKHFIEKTSVEEKEILSEKFYIKPKDKILLEEYRIKKLEINRELLIVLCAVLGKKGLMMTGGKRY